MANSDYVVCDACEKTIGEYSDVECLSVDVCPSKAYENLCNFGIPNKSFKIELCDDCALEFARYLSAFLSDNKKIIINS